MGASNSVNLTDGLDGLASSSNDSSGCLALIAYLVGNAVFSNYLQLHYVPGAGVSSFLWFIAWCWIRFYGIMLPARVFMGDTGSLALGAALGAISVITKHELVLAIVGGLFVLEAVSVIVQVLSFRLTGKRIFAMAHCIHFEERLARKHNCDPILDYSFCLALAGLATLKLR